MKPVQAILSGLVGAVTVTMIHETVRRFSPDAPRMDVLGKRAIAILMRKADQDPPRGEEMHATALVGDIIGNALYYTLVGFGKPESASTRGALLGLVAGIGGVVLPGPIGLGEDASARTPQTGVMTVLWYTIGGLAAGAAYRLFARPNS